MNIDDFLDKVDGDEFTKKNSESPSDGNTSAQSKSLKTDQSSPVSDEELNLLNESVPQGWDDKVNALVAVINASIAHDNYDMAIQRYLELKELPSKIIESDLQTQATLKEELRVVNDKLTSHMQEIEAKHSEQTSQLKTLISMALSELHSGKSSVASNLYLKSCNLYNKLPPEFKARNVKLHYDLLKLYYAIKEAHDANENANQSNFFQTFAHRYNESLKLVHTDVVAA